MSAHSLPEIISHPSYTTSTTPLFRASRNGRPHRSPGGAAVLTGLARVESAVLFICHRVAIMQHRILELVGAVRVDVDQTVYGRVVLLWPDTFRVTRVPSRDCLLKVPGPSDDGPDALAAVARPGPCVPGEAVRHRVVARKADAEAPLRGRVEAPDRGVTSGYARLEPGEREVLAKVRVSVRPKDTARARGPPTRAGRAASCATG